MTAAGPLDPGSALRAELDRWLDAEPELRSLAQRPAPDATAREIVRPGASPFFVVRIPLPQRPGSVWVSRLPGTHLPTPEPDLDALRAFGVTHVFCLLPSAILADARAHAYARAARETFGAGFHQVEILDHQVPPDDVAFERAVEAADAALAQGARILVHCLGGCGRSGLFVACLSVRAGLEARAAIDHFREARGCGPETPAQMAYVMRYASRLTSPAAPVVRFTRGRNGRILLARGGLASIWLGRVRLPSGRTHRVAIKDFVYRVTDADAARLETTIEELRRAGVRLPKMFMHRFEDRWVQVSQLFGSTTRGSKLGQPSLFYQRLSAEDRDFAADQLGRVARAGYLPTIDLFLVLVPPRRGLVPFDLDLVVPEPSAARRSLELLKRLLHVSRDRTERDRALRLALASAGDEVGRAVESLLASTSHPMRRLWDAWVSEPRL